jgi:hypothetical protein
MPDMKEIPVGDEQLSSTPMEISFVVSWSQEVGWYVDYEGTSSRFPDGNVWIPQLNEWIKPSSDSESLYFEDEMYVDISNRIKH